MDNPYSLPFYAKTNKRVKTKRKKEWSNTYKRGENSMKKSFVKSLGAATILTLTLGAVDIDAKASEKEKVVASYSHIEKMANAKQKHPIQNGLVVIQKPVQETKANVTAVSEKRSMYYEVNASFLNVRAKGHYKANEVDVLVKDWIVEVTEVLDNGWGKLKQGGYINLKYASKIKNGKERLEEQSKKPKPAPKFKQKVEEPSAGVYKVQKKQKQVVNNTTEVYETKRYDRKVNNVRVVDKRNQKPAVQEKREGVSNGKYKFSAYEMDLFARIVRAEAGDEPYIGQVAVASVILNRLDSSQFPNTLQGVIYAKNQFSPVMNGTINQPATESTKRAVRDAIAGNNRLYGAIYFYAPKYVKSPFMESRPTITTIGGHVFKK